MIGLASATGWLSFYYGSNQLIIRVTHFIINVLLNLIRPLHERLENLSRRMFTVILGILGLGYIALTLRLENMLEPLSFTTEGYITQFSLRQVFTVANRPSPCRSFINS